jgi:DNA primase
MLLHQPDLLKIESHRSGNPMPYRVSLLLELLELLQRQPGLNTGAVLEHWRGREESRYLHKLAQWTPLTENLDLAAEVRGHLNRITHRITEMRIGELLDAERHRTLNEVEKQELKALFQSRTPDAWR